MGISTKEFIVRSALAADEKFIEHTKQTTFDHIDKLLGTKGDEYSNKSNRFENFMDASNAEQIPPERALWFMMLKHIISVRKFVKELKTKKRRPLSQWIEKIDDIITYLILLKAMVRRRLQIEQVIDARRSEGDSEKMARFNETLDKLVEDEQKTKDSNSQDK